MEGSTNAAAASGFVESDPLARALLFVPPESDQLVEDSLYDRPSSPARMGRELRNLAARLREDAGVDVSCVEVPLDVFRRHPNVHFLRDSLLATPLGVVVARPAMGSRRGETEILLDLLHRQGITVLGPIRPPATLEGADCLWLEPAALVCAVGGRTSEVGVAQLERMLEPAGVRCHRVSAPRGVRHLLGAIQLVGPHLALVRADLLDDSVRERTSRLNVTTLPVPECAALTGDHGFNFVVTGPRRVVASAGHPELVTWLRTTAGVEVVGQVSYAGLAAAGGGIACATGVLQRRRRL